MRLLLLLACAGCHLGDAPWMEPDAPAPAVTPAPAPAPPPKPIPVADRVALAIAQGKEDSVGRAAFGYVASKAGKQHAPSLAPAIDQMILRMLERPSTPPSGCSPVGIERTISPRDPVFVQAARVSPHVFAYWIATVEALWIARARCADGPAVFVITAYRSGPDAVLLVVSADDYASSFMEQE